MKRMMMTLAVLLTATSVMAAPLAGVTVDSYSSQFSATYGADKSLDGNTSTSYYSSVPDNAPYVIYNLNQTTILDSVTITAAHGNFRRLSIAEISVSTNGVDFTSLGQYSVGVSYSPQDVTFIDLPNTEAAYVKIFGAQAYYSNWDSDYVNAGETPTVSGGTPDKYAVSYSEITFEAVPEPASMALLAMGGLLMVARRR